MLLKLKNLVSFVTSKNRLSLSPRYIYTNTVQNKMSSSIVWMDLEMTGLEVERDKILEVSCIITDKHLNITAECETFIIHEPDSVLENMSEWCIKNHAASHLTESVRKSTLTTEQAEQQLLEFLIKWVPPGTCPLAGNSVHWDRIFLKHHMPKVNDYMHYRIIDVSTVKELCKRFNPTVFSKVPKKELKHRSLEDIKESINELKYYKEHFLKGSLD